MKSLVLFDSTFGNTKKIAEIIAKGLGKGVKAVSVSDINHEELHGLDLLVIGSPIIAWRPSPKMGTFLRGLKSGSLEGTKCATFDTRIDIKIHGDAGGKIAKKLEKAGAEIIIHPEFFFVLDKEGPLAEGQEGKAAKWAKKILDVYK